MTVRDSLCHRIGAVPPPDLIGLAEAHALVDGCDADEAASRALFDVVQEWAARRGDVWAALLCAGEDDDA